MPKLIGTAGHVDHGKTTLIHALTGVDTDRFPEEKARGMTIDIGFAHLDLPEVGRVSIVDVPGHERFIRNMLAGALGIDLALLCVAADEGVKPQTKEHLQILELLPVHEMVIALTRADLADEITRQLAKEEVEELLSKTKFKSAPIVEVSAVTGEGIETLKKMLQAALKTEEKERQGLWYLPIDRAFSAKGHGVVVTGTLARGEVQVGDKAFIEPGHLETRVRGMQIHGEETTLAEPGVRTALNLGGLKLEQLHRGQSIGAQDSLFETKILDAVIRWVDQPKHAQRVRAHIGTEETIGKIFLNDENEELIQLRLETPVACAKDQPLILRRYSPPSLLGGGYISIPQAHVRRKSEKATITIGATIEDSILAAIEQHPHGVKTEEICRVLGQTPQQLGDRIEFLADRGKIVGFAGIWFTTGHFEAARNNLLEKLDELHTENPTKAWTPRELVVTRAGFKWSGKPLDRIISAIAEDGLIGQNGTFIRSSDFKLQLSAKQIAFLGRVLNVLNKSGTNSPSPSELTRELHVPQQATDEIIKLGMQAGEIVRVAEDLYYSQHQIEEIKVGIKTKFGSKHFAASEFRDAFDSSRRYVIPLLEYLDSAGFTLRVGDKRVVRS
ncbi:MAG TPA: selenocysteine-specific translation elongation factor [Fimbriimonadaceae bacterium]|jgi:selenocysteine-specific elongation factor